MTLKPKLQSLLQNKQAAENAVRAGAPGGGGRLVQLGQALARCAVQAGVHGPPLKRVRTLDRLLHPVSQSVSQSASQPASQSMSQ